MKLIQFMQMHILEWQHVKRLLKNMKMLQPTIINTYSSIFIKYRLCPNLPNGFYNKGDILICMGKIEEGIECITRAIELRPNWPLYYCNRVKQYIKLGKKDLVIYIIFKAIDDFITL